MNESIKKITLNCPTCQKEVLWNDSFPHRPFCSKRCKLIDFGDWATEKNKLEGNDLTDDIYSEEL